MGVRQFSCPDTAVEPFWQIIDAYVQH